MEENDQSNYLNLLQQIHFLKNISNKLKYSYSNGVPYSENVDELINILNKINELLSEKSLDQRTMPAIFIMNSIVEIATFDQLNHIISQDFFQLLYKNLLEFLNKDLNEKHLFSILSFDIFVSIIMNLAKQSLINQIFKRLSIKNFQSNQDSNSITTNQHCLTNNFIDFNSILINYLNYVINALSYIHSISLLKNIFKSHLRHVIEHVQIFFNDCLINENKQISIQQLDIISILFNFILNLSQKMPFAFILIDTNYGRKIIQWIDTQIFLNHIQQLGTIIFKIIFNLSKFNRGSREFRFAETFDCLIKHYQLIDKQQNLDMIKYYGGCLLYSSINNQQFEQNKQFITKISEIAFKWCQQINSNKEFKLINRHLSEPLDLLCRTFSYESIVKFILDKQTEDKLSSTQFFLELFLSSYGVLLDPEPDYFDKCTVKYLLEIFLQIMKFTKVNNKLIDDPQFRHVIKYLSDRTKNSYTNHIWDNIQLYRSKDKTYEQSTLLKISIHYHSSDELFLNEFIHELHKQTKITISTIDENIHSDDDINQFYNLNIESTTIFIFLLSKNYDKDQRNIQQLDDIMFAIQTNQHNLKQVIFIIAEYNFSFEQSTSLYLYPNITTIKYNTNINKIVSHICQQIKTSHKHLSFTNRIQSRKLFNCIRKHHSQLQLDEQQPLNTNYQINSVTSNENLDLNQ